MHIRDLFNYFDVEETANTIAVLALAINRNQSFFNCYLGTDVYIHTIQMNFDELHDVKDPVEMANMIVALGFKLYNTLALKKLKRETR